MLTVGFAARQRHQP